MTTSRFLLLLPFFYALLVSCSLKGENPAPSQEDRTDNALQAKADTALAFCKTKGMNTDFCFLIDMSIHSGKNRLFVWDFKEKKATYAALCCHGAGGKSTVSTPEFSNVPGSNCTSLGKYKLGIRSYSRWGINIHYKMHGLEPTNNNAFKRNVVFHSHSPVPGRQIYPFHLPLGWSLGCPVVANKTMEHADTLLQKVKKPVLMWIYS